MSTKAHTTIPTKKEVDAELPIEPQAQKIHWWVFALVGLLVLEFVTIIVLALVWWPLHIFYKSVPVTVKSTLRSVKIVAVGDISCGPDDPKRNGIDPTRCQDNKVFDLIKTINPDKILLLGDIQYSTGSIEAFNNTFNTNWGQLKSKFLPTPGNHEYGTKNAQGYFTYMNDGNNNGIAGDNNLGYYASEINNWSIYSLDSNCPETNDCSIGSKQIQWLESQLSNESNTCQLAFWHHPQFSSGKHSADSSQINRLPDAWKMLQDKKAEIVLNGHDHIYERFDKQLLDGQKSVYGIQEFVVGSGGYSHYERIANRPNSAFFNNTDFGVLVLELYQGSYNWKFINLSGQVLDEGAETCNK
ncbi:MAG: metallophosphoesterase [Candidatus Saccharibacteria bacterium]